ncbi:ABC transporter substrate-binding protein [Sulfurimonas sp. MAG313]|nr:ABC transporter substrate-binding protein [Sulfurimonas sp. MAG313]MDF1881974.1 ABC transporter substrate-binding protein [Sulfurimonas sp. MAG313]
MSRVKASYLNKLDIFADAEVKIKDAVLVKKKRIQVTALLASGSDTKKLIYKFYQTKKKTWLIYDISIVGVSFLQSYRVQYQSYLKDHSFDELLQRLQEKDSKE